jgi:Zn-finger nucleic acid-binding protein
MRQQTGGDPTMPRCPKCKTQLAPIGYEGVRIYNCDGCGGHWLSQARLDVILRRRELEMPEAVKQKMMDLADASNAVERLTCFTCGKPMIREPFKYWEDIQIDRCAKCEGIWLDRGELEKCQIYWEYAQDHPEEWQNAPELERKALLELEWQKRRDESRALRESAAAARYGGNLASSRAIARALTGLFGR